MSARLFLACEYECVRLIDITIRAKRETKFRKSETSWTDNDSIHAYAAA
jgi:hypothetical protein